MESLAYATKCLQTADHLAYITFPLVKEKRLLLKILSELSNFTLNAINSVLQYEYYWKRIHIYTEARANLQTFKSLASRYEISQEQVIKMMEILSLNEKHKKSPFEFVRNDKIVIMSEGMHTDIINLEKIKGFLVETKDILRKINSKLKA